MATPPLLLAGAFDPGIVASAARSALRAGIDAETATLSETGQWLEDHDAIAIAVDMTSDATEETCLLVRSMSRFANVPIIGMIAELDDLAFPEMYGWGGDDVIRRTSLDDLVPRLRGLAVDTVRQPPSDRGQAVIADADRRRRMLYGRVLHNAGYDVRFALDAHEALVACRAPGAKLIVIDADLEPGGGIAVVKQLRADGIVVPAVVPTAPMRIASHRANVEGLAKVAVTDGFAPPENLLFVANELGRSAATDGRASARLLYSTVVAFRPIGRAVDALGCTYNISAGGLYVRTLAPLNAGDPVWIELLPPRSERRVRLEGKVVWRRRFGPVESATVPPGFAIQITDGTTGDLAAFEAGYRAFCADTQGV